MNAFYCVTWLQLLGCQILLNNYIIYIHIHYPSFHCKININYKNFNTMTHIFKLTFFGGLQKLKSKNCYFNKTASEHCEHFILIISVDIVNCYCNTWKQILDITNQYVKLMNKRFYFILTHELWPDLYKLMT